MAFNEKQLKNIINVRGLVLNYSIKKDTEAKRMFAREGFFKVGDKFTEYRGFVDILTNVETGSYVRVNVQSEYKTYNSGANQGKPSALTETLEAMASKELDTYRKTGKVEETPTISVWGREPYNFKFGDNFYFKDGELVETVTTDLGFANMTVGDPEAEPRFENDFTVHAYVSKLEEETDKDGLPTGRVVVTASVPYVMGRDENKKIVAFNIPLIGGMCEDEEGEYDIAKMLLEEQDEYGVVDYCWELTGRIHSWTDAPVAPVEEAPTRRGGGRKAKVVETGRHMCEFLLEGYYLLGEDGDAFTQEDMTEAFKARQILVENKRKKAEEKAQQGSSTKRDLGGRSSGRGGATSTASTTTASTSGATEGTRRARRSW